MRTCTHAHTHAHTYIHAHTHTRSHTHTVTHTHTIALTHDIHIHTHTHTLAYAHTQYTHTVTHTHTIALTHDIHIHTHTHTCLCTHTVHTHTHTLLKQKSLISCVLSCFRYLFHSHEVQTWMDFLDLEQVAAYSIISFITGQDSKHLCGPLIGWLIGFKCPLSFSLRLHLLLCPGHQEDCVKRRGLLCLLHLFEIVFASNNNNNNNILY